MEANDTGLGGNQPVERSAGLTDAERRLGKLCERSFLSLWSYANVYSRPGQELCDVLVVFGNHVLIFSDKCCEFPERGDLQLRWKRWYKRAICKSAQQVWGAERWIQKFPERLYLDAACTKKLPIAVPPASGMVMHRIIVAHGAAKACKKHFGGGNGSLMINTGLQGDDHVDPSRGGEPFGVGYVDASRRYVHVLDDFTLDVVMRELDTITDFVWYLQKKEELFARLRCVVAAGEEEVLAWYLKHLDERHRHGFAVSDEVDFMAFDEGMWDEYLGSDARARKKQADAVSYSWDALIEKSNYHAMTGTQYWNSHGNLQASERSFRLLASEPRVRRRMLATSILDLIAESDERTMKVRVVKPSRPGDPYYVFLVVPRRFSETEAEYREGRGGVLEAYCLVTRLQFSDALDIVGIATEAGKGSSRSEDIMYYDARNWDAEDEADAKDLQSRHGLLTRLNMFEWTEQEYPHDSPRTQPARLNRRYPRNAKCPCGSGLKYKRCCGR